MKTIEWLKEKVKEEYEYNGAKHNEEGFEGFAHREFAFKYVLSLLDQLDEPEVLSQEWIKENEEQIDPNNPSNTWWVEADKLRGKLVPEQEEITEEQFIQYAKEHGWMVGTPEQVYNFQKKIEELNDTEVTEEQAWEPETVASVLADFWKSFERFKEVLSMEVEEVDE